MDTPFYKSPSKEEIAIGVLFTCGAKDGAVGYVRSALEDKKIDINTPCPPDLHQRCSCIENDTALHIACREGHLDIVQYLLKNGANPAVQNVQGDTPLMVTVSEINDKEKSQEISCRHIVQELLAAGADANTRNHLGNTVLMVAYFHDRSAIAYDLVMAGAEITLKNKAGVSIEDLLQRNAAPSARTFEDMIILGIQNSTTLLERQRVAALDAAIEKAIYPPEPLPITHALPRKHKPVRKPS